jgi:hypothetical protein
MGSNQEGHMADVDPANWTEEQIEAYYGTADDPIEESDEFESEGEAELLAINDSAPAGDDGSTTA